MNTTKQRLPKVGDRVRLTGDSTWTPSMAREAKTKTFRVVRVLPGGSSPVAVEWPSTGYDCWWVEGMNWEYADTAPVTEKTEHNADCPRCGSPAYRGFVEVECSARCCPETTPRGQRTAEILPDNQETIPF